jgi:hypothetical protein
MTEEQKAAIDEKVAALTDKYKSRIIPVSFTDENGEPVTGYMKEPTRMVKARVLDKAIMTPVTAGLELLEICLLKEESDARIYSEAPENDSYALGMALAAYRSVEVSLNSLKKK